MDMAQRIDQLLETPRLAELVAHYFALDGVFAGHTFDDLGENPAARITSDDLLAVTLLDVRFQPSAVRRLLAGEFDDALRAVPADVALCDLGPEVDEPAAVLWKALRELDGVGPTLTSKLLARKRPQLCPIEDSVIVSFVCPEAGQLWYELAGVLRSTERRDRIDSLWPGGHEIAKPTTLRLLDVAIWMRCSRSQNARVARDELGIDDLAGE
jgi:Family of unknown function (DUF6308)